MTKEEKLNNLIHIIDNFEKLDNKFGIDKNNLKRLYKSILNINDEKIFNEIYKLVIYKFAIIFNNLTKLNKKISQTYNEYDEKVDNFDDDKALNDIEKQLKI